MAVILRVFGMLLGVSLARSGLAPIKVFIKPERHLNLDDHGCSLPIVMRFYQLSDSEAFLDAGFWSLWRGHHNALGQSVLQISDIEVKAGRPNMVMIPRHHDARYLGIVAIFRSPGRRWCKLYKINQMLPELLEVSH